MTHIDPYNPLELEALGGSLIRAMERRPLEPLKKIAKFNGSGIYALYYIGQEHPYAELGEFNRLHHCRLPIYIGRAKDPGARQGISPFDSVTVPLLYGRVSEHKNSILKIEKSKTTHIPLKHDDFKARALVCLPLWVPIAEAMAIRLDQPLWNSTLSGFGIHAPGKGRDKQKRSRWDQMHTGRKFAMKLPENEQSAEALAVLTHAEAVASVKKAAARLGLDLPPSLAPSTPAPTPPQP